MNASVTTAKSPGPWQSAWQRLRRQRTGFVALLVVVFMIVLCAAGPWFSSYTESGQNLDAVMQPPSSSHWMGTDGLGRDIATRTLYGGRVSLKVAFVATLVAVVIGTLYGMISGLAGGRTDMLLMRVVDILYSFPFLPFIILLTVVFKRSFLLLYVAIGAIEWLTTARVVRAQVLGLKNQEFVLAARTYGARNGAILFRHLLPNVLGQVIIYATLTVPGVMLTEAVLSFLGLGVPPPSSSWGVLIQDGAANMQTSPWLLVFPGVFFVTTLLALNLLGDGLRDALDPKGDR